MENEHSTDGIDKRAERYLKALARPHGTSNAPSLPVDLHRWVTADIEDYRSLGKSIARARLDTLAKNFALPEYAAAMQFVDPGFARKVRTHADLVMVSDFMLANAYAAKDTVAERLAEAPAQLSALLEDADWLSKSDLKIARRLHWLSSVHLNDVQATIATILGRADANDRVKRADESRAAVKKGLGEFASANAALHDLKIQEVADFIAANRGVLSWKVRENIANADAGLRAFLADSQKMLEADIAVSKRLAGMSPLFIAEIQAIIAKVLDRSDAERRSTVALQLRRSTEPGANDRARTTTSTPATPLDAKTEIDSPSHVARQPLQAHDQQNEAVPGPIGVHDIPLGGPGGQSNLPPPLDAGDESSSTANAAPLPPPAPKIQGNAFPALPDLNAIIPGNPGSRTNSPVPIGNLLEHITYKALADGSVLYSLNGKSAFIDRGDRMDVVKSADTDERAILAALLTAKEKYAGNFELTGTQTFQRQAIEIMIKYQINAQLNSPAQALLMRQLSQSPPEKFFAPASPDRPVKPVVLATHALPTSSFAPAESPQSHNTRPAQDMRPQAKQESSGKAATTDARNNFDAGSNAPKHTDTATNPEGWVVKFGPAPFEHDPKKSKSFFVELENATGDRRTIWGVDLERAAAVAGMNAGDYVLLRNLGSKPVAIQQIHYDDNGMRIGTEWQQTTRKIWAINITPGMNTTQTPQGRDLRTREPNSSTPDIRSRKVKQAPKQTVAKADTKLRRIKPSLPPSQPKPHASYRAAP